MQFRSGAQPAAGRKDLASQASGRKLARVKNCVWVPAKLTRVQGRTPVPGGRKGRMNRNWGRSPDIKQSTQIARPTPSTLDSVLTPAGFQKPMTGF